MTTEGTLEHRSRTMLDALRGAGMKLTPQRRAIARAIAMDASHPTAQALFARLRPGFPKMSFATVYNTLDALSRAGQIHVLKLGGAARFDPNTYFHHHAICSACGSVWDVPSQSSGSTEARTDPHPSLPVAFRVESIEQLYRGVCASCDGADTRSS